MTRFLFVLPVLTALLVAFDVRPAAAIVRSWDDAGNDASKEWSVFGNWDPDGAVGFDDIFIGNLANAANDTTIYDVPGQQIVTLTLSNGADVNTNGNELIVNGLTTLGGVGTSIIIPVNSGGAGLDSLDTDELIVNASGLVSMTGGRMEVDTNQVQIEPGGTISGNGFINLDQSVAAGIQIFENSGTLIATSFDLFGTVAATLTINQLDVDGVIDLDGDTEAGVVNINRNDTLDVNATMPDGFSGTLNFADGATLDMRDPWSLVSGDINVNTGGVIVGSAGDPAEIIGAQFTMTSGTITLNTGDIDTLRISSVFVANGGTIANSNEIIFDNTATINAGVDFQMPNNASSITVTDGNTVTINDADFNLDGNEAAGNITTIGLGATLDINYNDVAADDSFGNTINLNGGILSVSNAADALPWSLNSVATVNAAGGATSTISGDAMIISASINVTGNSTLTISADSDFLAATVVVAAGSTFNVNSSPTYNGGSYTGAGIMRPGASTIATATTWGVDTVDLDDGSHTLNANLTINTNAIDTAGDGFDLTMTIADAAVLTVNIGGGGSWTVDGTGSITYNGDAAVNTFLAGSNINLDGTLNVNGDGRTDAVLNIGSAGVVNINTAGQPLRLSGGNTTTNTNTIAGGTINGPGILGADSGTALVGSGTINADVDFDGSSNLQADNGTLTVNTVVDVGTIGTADADGRLNVIPAWNTNVAQLVDLNGGVLLGGDITNDEVSGINGDGQVTARVINNTRIDAENNGLLIVQTAGNNNDWDGTTNTGSLNALSGNLEVRDNAAFLFSGTASAAAGRTLFANGFELEFEPASTLSLTGGTYRSTNATDIGGTVTIGAGTSTLQNGGTTVFEATSATTLTGDLRLDNPTRINAGATFTGGGTLINVAGRTLTLVDGADVDVLLENNGTLVLGTSPGQTQGLDFEQTAAGTWNVELMGTGINDYDRMTLTGLAAIDGTLNLSLLAPYVPTLLDPVFTILSASSVSGTFDAVIQPAGMPAGLVFDVIYNPGNVQLMVIAQLLGDYNQNGTVDAADYVLWRDTLGQAVAAFSGADGDGDGTVDNDDYGVWTAHFGNTAGSGSGAGAIAGVPEPSSMALLMGAISIAAMLRRRRQSHGS